ncbi:MAG TPA: PE-PPE domain-containing protein [Mycobacterium sp.]|nr:PE-PPE domain-containing protein [Mycobacterium sp.]
MATARSRSLGPVLLAFLTAVALGVSPPLYRLEKLIAEVALLAGEGWIMSGTGQPDPTVGPYISQVEALYLRPDSPLFPGQQTFPGYTFAGLTTPEQFCPFVCLPPPNPQLNFGASLTQGVADLNKAIVPQLQAGDNVAVLGYSQSATIATLEMQNLLSKPPAGVNLADLHTVLLGDPNNPIGGMLDRLQFPEGQHVPFVNIPLSIPPTPTEGIPTDIYTGEYDGWANFPQDQTNILAVINALIGIVTVHGFYPAYTPDQVASAIDIGSIGDASFYMIPQNLPILQFMYNGGTAGQFFGDLFSPWLRLVIDWAYGNAGDPAVDGLHPIPGGTFIEGSAYQQAFGVAGGPWAATPFGDLYQGSAFTSAADSGVAGFFEKMDPLQMLAGVQNAAIQSLVGPWADVAAVASGGTLTAGDISTIDGITSFLQVVTGYDLVNSIDQALLTGWNDLANLVGLDDVIGPAAVLDGPLISGQPVIDLVGLGFSLFNVFGA